MRQNLTNGARFASIVVLALLFTTSACGREDRPKVLRSGTGEPLLGKAAKRQTLERTALQLTLGLGRDADSLTFGEWARSAYAAACPGLHSEEVAFTVSPVSAELSEVEVTFQRSGSGTIGCPTIPRNYRIAGVRSVDGAVVAPIADSNSMSGVPGADWLSQFRAGFPLPGGGRPL